MAFICGMALNAFTIAEKIATKPYVDEKTMEGRKYTDDKAAQTLASAFEHSDMNRQQMLLQIQVFSSDMKVQGVKIDNLSDAIRELSSRKIKNER